MLRKSEIDKEMGTAFKHMVRYSQMGSAFLDLFQFYKGQVLAFNECMNGEVDFYQMHEMLIMEDHRSENIRMRA